MRLVSRPRLLFLATLLGSVVLAAAAALPWDFLAVGSFKRMLHTGNIQGQRALADLPQGSGRWGVGAGAGLESELIQLDGRLLVSPGSDPQGRLRAPVAGEQALLFAGALVPQWQALTLPQAMDAPALHDWLVQQMPALGLAPDQPLVFRVEGRFPQLVWHVVTGAAGAGAGAGQGSGGGHSNHRAGQRVFDEPGVSGLLVGAYSGEALEGVVSHPGERLHLHFVDAAQTRSGHVDQLQIAAGAVVWLPKK